MNILLVDDHEVVRRGLRQMLAEEVGAGGTAPHFGEAATAAEALARLREARWDLAILDIRMPGRSGLDIIAEMQTRQPGLRVLVLSMACEAEFAERALRNGAAGYLSKDALATELISAVKKVLSGGHYISPSTAEKLAASLTVPTTQVPRELLSDRELQVLCLIAGGRSIREIAAELSLSEKTVATYRDRLRDKLGLRNDADITRYALRHGLIE